MKVFPAWAEALGLGDVAIRGIDLPLHAPKEMYVEAVDFLKNVPLSLGALVTHKLDLYASCLDKYVFPSGLFYDTSSNPPIWSILPYRRVIVLLGYRLNRQICLLFFYSKSISRRMMRASY